MECDTGSESVSLSTTRSPSISMSDSRSQTMSNVTTVTPSGGSSVSESMCASWSSATTVSKSNNCTSLTVSSSATRSATPQTATFQLSSTISSSATASNSSTPTSTLELTATRYYSRDLTLVEIVAVSLALGLSVPAVLGGIGGGTMTSSLSRVVAARNIGQCWGPAGSSVFSYPVDLCDYPSNDEDQLEGQGDALIGIGAVLCGAALLLISSIVYWRAAHRTLWRKAAEEMSLLSVLSPLWVAALPIFVSGGVTTLVAPMSAEHPLGNTCDGTAALIASCFVLTLLLMGALAVVPLASPALFGVTCECADPRYFKDLQSGPTSRLVAWLRSCDRRRWRWEPINTTSTSHRMVRTVLLEYRALWYAALDSVCVCAVAVLGSIGPLLPWAPCVGTGASVVVLFAAQLIACIVSRPMARPLDGHVCSVTLTLTTSSSLLRVIYGASTTDDERKDRGALLTAAASLDIAVSIVTLGPIIIDMVELARHSWAKWCSKDHQAPNYLAEGDDIALNLLEDGVVNDDKYIIELEMDLVLGAEEDMQLTDAEAQQKLIALLEESEAYITQVGEEAAIEVELTDDVDASQQDSHAAHEDELLHEGLKDLEPTGAAIDGERQVLTSALLEAYEFSQD
ncbi:transmembrane protein, putative [Bodo saltans]|uniref:Transmembrane protein, putative n=1 Tax=Bodo saltans TaxID=75058 RepID=A0A0S4J0W2_BODSA|nr:transmembrane protein, putative [Bodo saltans]|eukprot:CUG76406.1 transmembrane protein, putative [Bodo saltans]